MSSTFGRKGRASSTEESFAIYSQETLDADSKAIMMKVRDSVWAAVRSKREIIEKAGEFVLKSFGMF